MSSRLTLEPVSVIVAPNGLGMTLFAIDTTREDASKTLKLAMDILNAAERIILLYTGNFKTVGVDQGIANSFSALAESHPPRLASGVVSRSPADILEYRRMAVTPRVGEQPFFWVHHSKEPLALFQRVADMLRMYAVPA